MAKNSRTALCCQNRVSKGPGQHYGLYSSASRSVHSASVTEIGLLKKMKKKKKKELVQNSVKFYRFQVSHTCNWLIPHAHLEWVGKQPRQQWQFLKQHNMTKRAYVMPIKIYYFAIWLCHDPVSVVQSCFIWSRMSEHSLEYGVLTTVPYFRPCFPVCSEVILCIALPFWYVRCT